MRDDQFVGYIGLQLIHDRFIRNSMGTIPPNTHVGVLRWNRHVRGDFGHGAMEVGIEDDEIRNSGKEPQRFAHDVDGNWRMQRRKGRVALHLIDQLGCDELVFLHSWSAGNHAMTDCHRRGEVGRVQRIRDQFEGDGASRQRRCFVDKLLATLVLDPEFAKVGADSIDCALVQLGSRTVAGFVNRKLDGGRTTIQNQDRQRRHERKPLKNELKNKMLVGLPAPIANLRQVVAVL